MSGFDQKPSKVHDATESAEISDNANAQDICPSPTSEKCFCLPPSPESRCNDEGETGKMDKDCNQEMDVDADHDETDQEEVTDENGDTELEEETDASDSSKEEGEVSEEETESEAETASDSGKKERVGVHPITGRTEKETRALFKELQAEMDRDKSGERWARPPYKAPPTFGEVIAAERAKAEAAAERKKKREERKMKAAKGKGRWAPY
ncbi:hypothetical protein A1O3_07967 [Capronia epimyces CBS 606.96]|uniref:Uncharacterized protein n=1 Tax=Capronia epimyces CBS 606.96 TaxID=1182542 RepID=W9XRR7_9EURO|nr:uncharacterized protein A1O3_07967 [Capronia epimyces CBS 606.96]EXJ79686.1 hypothetical protein A1O3_07967 [Capronia epimyces CBS 606.96]